MNINVPKIQNLRQQILTLHDLHQKWLPSEIADELINSGCPPPQKRYSLIRYIRLRKKFVRRPN